MSAREQMLKTALLLAYVAIVDLALALVARVAYGVNPVAPMFAIIGALCAINSAVFVYRARAT